MKDLNRIFLLGRLGADAQLRDTKSGKKLLTFPLATSRFNSKKLEKEETADLEQKKSTETQWHQVVLWGKLGEACAPFLKKGNAVFVEGEVRTKKYLAKDGYERWNYEVNAKEINMLPSYRGQSIAN